MDGPSLRADPGRRRVINPDNKNNEPITIIRNFYLKNIQRDLLEEMTMEEAKLNEDIEYISR